MTRREFFKQHFLKLLLIFIILQLGIITIVQKQNHKPVAVKDEKSVIEGRQLKISPLFNDTDKDKDDKLVIASIKQPLHGKAEFTERLITYIPSKGFFGNDSMEYTISDGDKESKAGIIRISVIENLPPNTQDDKVTLYNGSLAQISVLKNDKDKENDSLYITEYTSPGLGVLKQKGNLLFYSANSPKAATDSFQYTISDGKSISRKTTVHINIKAKTDAMYPWLVQDVGNTAIKGKVEKKGNKYIVFGSGADVWWQKDAFTYMYQYVSGDFEISTRVNNIEATEDHAKSGIMVRKSLDQSSEHVFLALNYKMGISSYQRSKFNGQSASFKKVKNIYAPYWLKLKRKGTTFSFEISKDNKTWEEISQIESDLPEDIYLGLVTCSHKNNEVAKNTYSHLYFKKK